MHIWHQLFAISQHLLTERTVVESLVRAGIHSSAYDGAVTNAFGILFFECVSQELFDFLRAASRNGVERVLAIAVSRSGLKGGAAWQLLSAGASDVFAWDHSSEPAVEVAARLERWQSVDKLVNASIVQKNLVGESPLWKSVLRRIVEVARYTDASILIMGESGTGKELIARLIHTLDQRPRKRDLVTLDCTTIVPELSGSEFFGHDRGAYTGAVAEREGAFALADGGTLFLDEVGELSPRLQSELLRVVQERTYKRIGSNTWQETNFRLISATNRDLLQEEARGQFRRDFYYRIASWTCKLPPLRERAGDILLLARHFMQQLRPDDTPPEMDEPVREFLLMRDYPGNVRDLRQLVTRIMNRHVGPGPITAGDITEEERPACDQQQTADWRDASFEQAIRRALSLGIGLKEVGSAAAETAISIAVGDEDGNLQRAARKLGVTDRALQMRRAVRRDEARTPHIAATSEGNGDG
jgi:transcriptional regulator with GAF, ATPase, and Fis domain